MLIRTLQQRISRYRNYHWSSKSYLQVQRKELLQEREHRTCQRMDYHSAEGDHRMLLKTADVPNKNFKLEERFSQ